MYRGLKMFQFQPACCHTCPKPTLHVCWRQGTSGRRAAQGSAVFCPTPTINIVSTVLCCDFTCVLDTVVEICKMCHCDIFRHCQQYAIKLFQQLHFQFFRDNIFKICTYSSLLSTPGVCFKTRMNSLWKAAIFFFNSQ